MGKDIEASIGKLITRPEGEPYMYDVVFEQSDTGLITVLRVARTSKQNVKSTKNVYTYKFNSGGGAYRLFV